MCKRHLEQWSPEELCTAGGGERQGQGTLGKKGKFSGCQEIGILTCPQYNSGHHKLLNLTLFLSLDKGSRPSGGKSLAAVILLNIRTEGSGLKVLKSLSQG